MSGRPASIILSSLSNVWYNMILWLPTIVRCYSIVTCPCHQTQDFSVALSNIFPHLNAPPLFYRTRLSIFFLVALFLSSLYERRFSIAGFIQSFRWPTTCVVPFSFSMYADNADSA